MLTISDPRLTGWTLPPSDAYRSLERWEEEELLKFLLLQREGRAPIPPTPRARDLALLAKLLPSASGIEDYCMAVMVELPDALPTLPPLLVGPAIAAGAPPLGQTFKRTEEGETAFFLLAEVLSGPDHLLCRYARIDHPAYLETRKRMRKVLHANL